MVQNGPLCQTSRKIPFPEVDKMREASKIRTELVYLEGKERREIME